MSNSTLPTLANMAAGTSFKVDGKTVYLASYSLAGNKEILFVGNTPQAAENPEGLHVFVDVKKSAIELPGTAKPAAQVTVPKAPKRADYPDTDEGEDEFSMAFGDWMTAKKNLTESAPIKPAQPAKPEAIAKPEPVKSEPVKAEPAAKLAETLLPVTQTENNPGFMPYHLAVWPDPNSVNNAYDYIAAVKKVDNSIGTELDAFKSWKELCLVLGIDPVKLANDNARRVLIRFLKDYQPTSDKPSTATAKPAIKAGPVAPEPKQQPAPKAEPAPKKAEAIAQPEPAPKAEPAAAVPTKNNSDVAAKLAAVLAELTGNVDPEQVAGMIEEAVRTQIDALKHELPATNGSPLTPTINVTINDAPQGTINGFTHYLFKDLVTYAALRESVYLVGPAGSGKSTVAMQVAESLGMEFYGQSVCAQTSKSEFLGYMDANGHYVSTIFRKAFEHGGLFLLDEIDNGNPNILSVLNSALSNGFCSFADGMVKVHPDFVVFAAGNTFGNGANVQYVGRNPIDGATLNRFTFIQFGYDEELETLVAGDTTWTAFVQECRSTLVNERIIISPRASIKGNKHIAAGFSAQVCLERLIITGADTSIRARIMTVFNRYKW